MTNKSQFLKSVKLVIAGVVLVFGVSSCSMMGGVESQIEKTSRAAESKSTGTIKSAETKVKEAIGSAKSKTE
ncbi:MAG: hypothetical protein ACJAZX_001407 [Rickettsiales bacterium]|jgi:hypothetical protein